MKLLSGEEADIPEYNFVTGLREYNGKKLRLSEGCILLIEGIHALNPRLTSQIPDEAKFKVFIREILFIIFLFILFRSLTFFRVGFREFAGMVP